MGEEKDVKDPWLTAWTRVVLGEDADPKKEPSLHTPYYAGTGGAKWDMVKDPEKEHLRKQIELLNEKIAELEEDLDAERGVNFGLRSMCRRLSDGMTSLKREFDKWSKWDVES